MIHQKLWITFSYKLILSSIFLILPRNNFITSVTSLNICNIDVGNYTQKSTYGNNLNRVLSSLSASINNTGFYYTSFGQNPDEAHVHVLCRGDVLLEICKNCTETAISDIQSACPNVKEAVDWQEFCMLKYSNDVFYGKLQVRKKYYMWNVMNVTSPFAFSWALMTLLSDLRSKAANGGDLMKMAAGNVPAPDSETIFAMVQCTPDLSPEDCTSCLNTASNDLLKACEGKTGCRVLLESCFLRYETYRFYNETRVRELSIIPVSSVPDIAPEPQVTLPPPPPPGNNKTRTIIIVVVVAIISILVIIGGIIFKKRAIHRRPVETNENVDEISTVESLRYHFALIRAATNDFSDENKLGQGGFGAVYKGKLQDGPEIAVKRLSKNSGQGDLEFKNEVLLLARLQHRNLVKLLGFSLEGEEKLLVYEFVQNASLDQFIFDPVKRSQLEWDRRSKIIRGIAKGLLYLHEDSRLRIIHRDLKTSNVLLDGEMNPKIADFGMARLFVQDDQTQGSTNRIVGTYGYMAPEYAMHGQFSIKSDVFSFGVLLLEIVIGQRNKWFRNGDTIHDLLSFAWKNWREGTTTDVIDSTLKSHSSNPTKEILRCIHIGLLCVQENATDRPTMASVVHMLDSPSLKLPAPSQPVLFVPGSDGNEWEIHNAREDLHIDTTSMTVSLLSKNEASITEIYPR